MEDELIDLENQLRPIGPMKGLIIKMSDDFDGPMDEFEDYM
jgi:hypothetical protein